MSPRNSEESPKKAPGRKAAGAKSDVRKESAPRRAAAKLVGARRSKTAAAKSGEAKKRRIDPTKTASGESVSARRDRTESVHAGTAPKTAKPGRRAAAGRASTGTAARAAKPAEPKVRGRRVKAGDTTAGETRAEAKARETKAAKASAKARAASLAAIAVEDPESAPEGASATEAAPGIVGNAPTPVDQESILQDRHLRYSGLPVVVIAGRPNVGKSTLYNRLLRKRRVITDPTPGVTRDPVESTCILRDSGKPVSLVDTGGFKLEREGLDSLVVEKSLASLDRADLILFLVDATEITPEDEEFAALLRKWSGKVLLCVNKADSPDRDALVWGHAKWGFDPVLFVSAAHGRNVDALEEAIVARLDFSEVHELPANPHEIRVAIMGKPNTGKSTLLNRLLGEEKSIVSDIAGTTRDVVEGRFDFKRRSIVVLDTAGIRRKTKVKENVEYYSVNRAIRTVNDCDVVILMIDAREGLTEQDKKITAFAAEKGRGVIFALNKWDEMPDIRNSFEAARDKLRYFFGQMAYAPVLPLSAKEGTGVEKLLNMVVSIHAQLTKEMETSRLNKAVADWIEQTPPPVGTRTRFKLRYAVQTSANPLHFVFFVTRPDAVREAYISFLRNKIRDELGYDKVPVFVELRASRQDRRA